MQGREEDIIACDMLLTGELGILFLSVRYLAYALRALKSARPCPTPLCLAPPCRHGEREVVRFASPDHPSRQCLERT